MGDNQKSRGQNFSTAELKQLCGSWMHISQDPIAGAGQRNLTFWDKVGKHYNDNRPRGTQQRGTRSLESKWGELKHDVAKFAGTYTTVVDARHSGDNDEDTIAKAKELYQTKHPKGKEFQFLDQWHLLKDCPKFANAMDDLKEKRKGKGKGKGASKSKDTIDKENADPQVADQPEIENDRRQSYSLIEILDEESAHDGERRLMGNKTAKKLRHDENSQRISANAQRDMVHINNKRLKLLEEQNRQNLFSLRSVDIDEDAREYFQISRARALKAFKKQVEMEDRQELASLTRTACRTPLPVHPSNAFVPSGPELNPLARGRQCVEPPEMPSVPSPAIVTGPNVAERGPTDVLAEIDELLA